MNLPARFPTNTDTYEFRAVRIATDRVRQIAGVMMSTLRDECWQQYPELGDECWQQYPELGIELIQAIFEDVVRSL